MSFYSQILRNVLLPAHNALKGRNYVRRRRFLEESQWWPRERLLAFQWKELQSLLAHAFHSVPYYQEKYAKAGIRLDDIRTMEDFSRLPILTVDEVNHHNDALCSKEYRGKLLPYATGGSTGIPTRFYRTIESYDWRTAATERAYSWTGCRLGEHMLYLWGGPVGQVSKWRLLKEKAHEFYLGRLIINTFSQNEQLWSEIYARAVKYKPKVIIGYVSSLQEFSRFLQSTGGRLPSVKAAIAAAEPLHEETREQISRGIGVPVFNTYGCRQFMSIGGECELHNGLHVHSENILVETARPPEEGPSQLLLTDLHNYGMPFIRHAIGDVGLLEESECSCGRGLPRLRSLNGRVLDMLRAADGRLVSGEFFPHLLKEIPEIVEYQVQQKDVDQVEISAVLSGPLSEQSRVLLDREFKKALGGGTKIEIRKVDKIAKLPSGKRRTVIGLPPTLVRSR